MVDEIVAIEARDLEDAWFQCMYEILTEGRVFTIDQGSYSGQKRLEFFYTVIDIRFPGTRPLTPRIPPQYGIVDPVDPDYVDNYLLYLMTPEKSKNESYTYGERLTRAEIPEFLSILLRREIEDEKELVYLDPECIENPTIIIREGKKLYLNQVEWVIWTYKNKGFRNNQLILQVGSPSDLVLRDPPCLRHIDTRIQDGKLHFFPYFRSWDLWGGFPANLAGIQLLKEYMASCIGVEDGKIVASSKGLHIYDYAFDIAKALRMCEDYFLEGESSHESGN